MNFNHDILPTISEETFYYGTLDEQREEDLKLLIECPRNFAMDLMDCSAFELCPTAWRSLTQFPDSVPMQVFLIFQIKEMLDRLEEMAKWFSEDVVDLVIETFMHCWLSIEDRSVKLLLPGIWNHNFGLGVQGRAITNLLADCYSFGLIPTRWMTAAVYYLSRQCESIEYYLGLEILICRRAVHYCPPLPKSVLEYCKKRIEREIPNFRLMNVPCPASVPVILEEIDRILGLDNHEEHVNLNKLPRLPYLDGN